jgi:hypothetical protein
MTYDIEIRTAGCWETIMTTDNLSDALFEASLLTACVREEWIRICTPDLKIL